MRSASVGPMRSRNWAICASGNRPRNSSTMRPPRKATTSGIDCTPNCSARPCSSYEELCDPTPTCFEPEALGQRVEGMAFHRFYFDLGAVQGRHEATMASPHVRVMGDVAVVTYMRLNQRVVNGAPMTRAVEET